MAEYFNSEGVSANADTYAEYSGNHFIYQIDGQFDAYYITRYAFAVDGGAIVSLTGNSVTLYGTTGADRVQIASAVSSANNSLASSYGNNWFFSLADGDDNGVIHSSVNAISPGSSTVASFDSSTLIGGAGSDTLLVSQNLGAYDGGYAAFASTGRQVDGGEGFDIIHAGLTVESGRPELIGGTASYSANHLFVDAGPDGGNILAATTVTAFQGGTVAIELNNVSLGNASFAFGNITINSGRPDTAGGTVNYNGNGLYEMAGEDGGRLYAQTNIFAVQGGYVSFADNSIIQIGQGGADVLNSGVQFTAGGGGSGDVSGNIFYADGGADADFVNFYLQGWADTDGSVNISGNSFYGTGGDGDDSLNLDWWAFANGGDVQVSGNSATFDAGAGSDTLFAYLGEGTTGNVFMLSGGDGNDTIQTLDWGQNNERLLSGGAGDDTIIDDIGFSTAQFSGDFADYTIKAIDRGWILVTDNRDGSPDGADQLLQVDQLSFGDGNVLISDLYLPIEGTEGDDTLFGGQGDDIILGYGGNDTLWGSFGNDIIDGGAGNDLLVGQSGNDTVIGGDGNDQVIGNTGADELSGGAGADIFAYGNRNQSTLANPDLIIDFSGQVRLGTNSQGRDIRLPGEGDKIDLSTIDADTTLAGNQAFTIVQHGFSGTAGELYSSYDAAAGITSIFVDVDGDANADMEIQLLGHIPLTGSDFIL